MKKSYKIIDIIHTGNHGPEGESKVGEKYDNRRGKVFTINEEDMIVGDSLFFIPILLTTPFVKAWYEDGYYWIQTKNSIYKCEPFSYIGTTLSYFFSKNEDQKTYVYNSNDELIICGYAEDCIDYAGDAFITDISKISNTLYIKIDK